ncbi:MAG TPA: hypothetical protein VKT28_14145 [Puia sp.]|nr:hypothetical protein [Puia sp.]
MKEIRCLALFICFFLSSSAQEKIRVKAGDDFSEALSSFGIYRFPQFKQADIFFRNGKESNGELNYNLVVGEIQFINDKGDTLSIANPEDLKYVKIDSVLYYYYDNKYIEILEGNENDIKVGCWQQIKIEFEELGAYDRPAGGNDVKSYKNYTSPLGSSVYDLKANQNRIITRETHCFLLDKYGAVFSVTKNNFLHFFPEKKEAILKYIDINKIDFKKVADLKRLFQFCRKNQ